MQVHELPKLRRKKAKRIGRGGKRGTYSGRGIKGQKARAGRRIRPAVRDIILRLPKRRGVKNPPFFHKPTVVNLESLKGLSGVVSREALEQAGIVKLRRGETLKILGRGKLTTPLVIRGIAVSRQAKEAIERAGGRVEGSNRE